MMMRGVLFAQEIADTSNLERWVALLTVCTLTIALLGVLWWKVLVPMVHGMDFLRAQVSPNGRDKVQGTTQMTTRDLLAKSNSDNEKILKRVDELAEDNRTMAYLVEKVRVRTEERHLENTQHMENLEESFNKHLAWSASANDVMNDRLDKLEGK